MSSHERATQQGPSRAAVFALVATGVFISTLDGSIVNVSLHAIAEHFGVVVGPLLSWVVLAYLVVTAALLLTVGRLADLLGHRVIWTLGLAVFSAGSALCAWAPSLRWLIAARAFQGTGGALLMANGPALLLTAFPPSQRGRALGLHAVVVGVGVSSGPVLGGLITERLGFRAIFYLNLPFGILGALLAWRTLPRVAPKSVHFDGFGALWLALALGTLTSGLSLGGELGFAAAPPVVLLASSCVSFWRLVRHEQRHPHPILDLSLFREPVFRTALVSLTLSFLASYALSFLLPLFLHQLRGLSLAQTGWLLTPLPLTIALLSPFSGALSDRVGTRSFAAFGMLLLSAGLAILSALGPDTPLSLVIFALLVAGVGQAIFRAPNNSALMGAAPSHRQGVASSLLATARVIGQSLSVAVASTIFGLSGSARAGRLLAQPPVGLDIAGAQRTFLIGYRCALWTMATVALLAALSAWTTHAQTRSALR
ncbi:MAG TPA: DHA2 family efflux MFS transporter permease subunit [Polyangiales bacterium]